MSQGKQVLGGMLLTAAGGLIVFAGQKIMEDSAQTMEMGEKAEIAEIVREVIRQEQVATINGETMTYGEALSLGAHDRTVMKAEIKTMKDAVKALSED